MPTTEVTDVNDSTTAQPAVCNVDGVLQCPACKGDYDYLHHRGVAPDPRPGFEGLVVDFYCESCGPYIIHRLGITQHKGQTFMEWL